MRTRLWKSRCMAGVAAALAALTALPAAAHHAFGAEFDANASGPAEGQDREDRVGESRTPGFTSRSRSRTAPRKCGWWRAGARTRCCGAGRTRTRFPVGTEIVVDGYQARDHSELRANARNVTFPDGRKLFLGSTGTGAPYEDPDKKTPDKNQ